MCGCEALRDFTVVRRGARVVSIVLRYFHNPEHQAAYELRRGLATLTPGLVAHATGAWPLFREQVRGG